MDTRMGALGSFPMLVDETTTRDAKMLAAMAYNIATGRTKGRLMGAEDRYALAETQEYSLVCFLSGENPIHEQVAERGGAARVMEIRLGEEEFLLPEAELPRWYARAREHYGWLGRNLVQHVTQWQTRDPGGFRSLYETARQLTGLWCRDHPRTLDFLAVLQLGYRLVGSELFGRDPGAPEAEAFAQWAYDRLDKTSKAHAVIQAIRQGVPGVETWAERGYIPQDLLEDIAEDLGWKRVSELVKFLNTHGLAERTSQPRDITDDVGPHKRRCMILTSKGKASLVAQGRSAATE
jgi:hypothetical protein